MNERVFQCEWEYDAEEGTPWLGKRKIPCIDHSRKPASNLKSISPRKFSRTSSSDQPKDSRGLACNQRNSDFTGNISQIQDESEQIERSFKHEHRESYPTNPIGNLLQPGTPTFRRPPQRKTRRFVTLLGGIVACSEDFKSGWMRTRNARRANHQKQFRYLINMKDAEPPNGKIVISVYDTGKSKVLARIVTTHGGYDSSECNFINLSRFSTLKLYPNELKLIEVFGDVSDSKNDYISEHLYFQSFDLKSRVSKKSSHGLLVKSGKHQYTTHSWTVTVSYDSQQLLIGGLMNVKYQPKPVQFVRSLSIPSIFGPEPSEFTWHRLLPTLQTKYECIPQVAPGFALVSLGAEAAEELEEELSPEDAVLANLEAFMRSPKLYLSKSKCIFQILSFPVEADLSPTTTESIPKVIYSSTKYPV